MKNKNNFDKLTPEEIKELGVLIDRKVNEVKGKVLIKEDEVINEFKGIVTGLKKREVKISNSLVHLGVSKECANWFFQVKSAKGYKVKGKYYSELMEVLK